MARLKRDAWAVLRRAAPLVLFALAACQSSAQRAANSAAEGQALFDAQRYREASIRLQYATTQRDDLPEVWTLLGRTRLALNDYAGAYAAYHNVIDLDRSNREALNTLAQLTLASRRYSDAKDFADQLTALDPSDINAQLVGGYALRGLGKYDDAEKVADTVLAQDGGNQNALVLKSDVLDSRGRLEQATDVLLPTLRTGNVEQPVLRQLLSLMRRTANGSGLVDVLERIMRAAPRDSASGLALAEQLYVVGRPADAAARLAVLHRTDPSDQLRDQTVAAWMDAGLTVDTVLASVTGTSREPELLLAAAEFAIEKGQPAQARQVLASLGDGEDVQGALALANAQLAAWPAAATLATAILAHDETQPRALMARSLVALSRRDTDSALADARLVLRDNPTMPAATLLLARVYAARNDRILYDRTFVDGLDAAPASFEMLDAAVAYYLRANRSDDAALASRQFTVDNPSSVAGWMLRRRVCQGIGDAACVQRATVMTARLRGAKTAVPPAGEDSGVLADDAS